MGKKDQKKPKEKPKEKPGKSVKSEQDQDEKPFDFGGIPDRNLKKNLGCG